MTRILLISCNETIEPYAVYPLGMTLVAQAARRAGHDTLEWDVRTEGSQAPVETFRPDLIGLSLRNIDNIDSVETASYIDRYREIVDDLRRRSDAPIVLGGAGYSLFPETLLDHLGADYGVAGEGERLLSDLADRLERGEAPARGVLENQHPPLAGEEFSSPERDARLAARYLDEGGMLSLQSKRGCPYRCAYCTYPLIEGAAYRFRPAEAVVDEIEALRDRYHCDYFSFTDSVFNDREGRYLEIAEEIVRRDIHVPWMAFFRPQRFRPEEVALLRRAGLHAVEWGADCAADATLEAMGKGFTWSEVEESTRLFASQEIANAHFIIFGGPGETPETAREGIENIARLERCVVFAFSGVRVLPRTTVHRLAIDEGIVDTGDDLLAPMFYHSPHVDREWLHRALIESFGERIDRFYPPGKDQDKAREFHKMGRRGPIWDLVLLSGGRRRRRHGTKID